MQEKALTAQVEQTRVLQKTGIVIPCYNEAKRLPVQDFLKFLQDREDYIFCFVNDGSKDGTKKLLEELAARMPGKILCHHMEQNSGKAEAVRQGVQGFLKEKEISAIGFLDADLSAPPEEMGNLVRLLRDNKALQIVCGSRIKRMGARIERNAKRHIIGRLIATFISKMLQLPFYDTQCGAKVFRKEICPTLFGERFHSKWLFDVEILFRMKKIYSREELDVVICESPLNCWIEKEDSRLGLRDFFVIPFELIRMKMRYKNQ